MFCFQCQETLSNTGCTISGVCGKKEETAKLQDLLVYTVKGVSAVADDANIYSPEVIDFVVKGLYTTVTNVSFDDASLLEIIKEGITLRDNLKKQHNISDNLHDSVTWNAQNNEDYFAKAANIGVMATEHEDVRSLRELLIYGLKGIASYINHATTLGFADTTIFKDLVQGVASTTKELSVDEMIAQVMKAGEVSVNTMSLLDKAHTETYGNPEITEVNIGVETNPGILISGHDLKDIEELLKQTEGTGVDVYTHGEMLPAHYYPAFKKYTHFVGNYGNAWWEQTKEFASFNGAVLLTTNCLVPPLNSYKERLFTTGNVAFADVKHVADRDGENPKDFSEIIALAKTLPAPTELETGSITGGFAHEQVFALADKVVNAVKSGDIKKFIVMAGCDGRQKERVYYTDFAKALPDDSIILTAGCAKYRYNKLDLGDIGGIPRVLDAGQCNDSYSLVLIALKLKEAFGLEDINDLPIFYNIAWYEQKAVAVLLALLFLGVKNIHLGPTLPGFLSPTVINVLVENFGISPNGTVENDLEKIFAV